MTEMLPCPFCGRPVDMDDEDTLYPSGIYWRYSEEIQSRYYVSHKERLEGDCACYSMHCPESSGGCGASISKDSYEEVIAAWNRRPA